MKQILALFMALLLASCNVRPLYLHDNFTNSALGEINLTSGSTIEDAEFYEQLSELLPSAKEPKYQLDYKLYYHIANSIILKNSDTIRKQLMLSISYNIKNLAGEIINEGSFNSFLSYDAGFSPYVTTQFNQQARIDLAKSAAKELFFRLQQVKFSAVN